MCRLQSKSLNEWEGGIDFSLLPQADCALCFSCRLAVWRRELWTSFYQFAVVYGGCSCTNCSSLCQNSHLTSGGHWLLKSGNIFSLYTHQNSDHRPPSHVTVHIQTGSDQLDPLNSIVLYYHNTRLPWFSCLPIKDMSLCVCVCNMSMISHSQRYAMPI